MVLDGFYSWNVLRDNAQRLPFLLLENDAVEIDDALLHRDREPIFRNPGGFRQLRENLLQYVVVAAVLGMT